MRNLFLDNRAVQVGCSGMERLHRSLYAHLYPVGLDMREVVEEQPCDGDRAQDVFFARDVRDNLVQRIVLRVVHERDEREESGRFVLQIAEHAHVGDAVFGLLDVAEQHGRVGRDADLVCGAVHVEPFLAGFLAGANLVAYALHQNFGASAGEGVQARVLESRHDLQGRLARDFREVANFYRGKGLQVRFREFYAKLAQHLDVVIEGMVGVEPAYDVQFPRAAGNRLCGLVPDGVVIPVVCGRAILLDFREGAELAVQNAHVGVVDLAVVHPVDGFSVTGLLFGVRACAEFVERSI